MIRRRPRLANPIILLTGDGPDPRATLPIVPKPFSLDAILSAIRARLSAA